MVIKIVCSLIKASWKKLGSCLSLAMLMGLACFLLFYNLAEDMLEQVLGQFDQNITALITLYSSPRATDIMKLLTEMGSAAVLISLALLAAAGLVYYKNRYWDAAMLTIALSGAFLMNYLLKLSFHRPRPDIVSLVKASGYSFPSGHAMASLAFYGMLAFLLWTYFRESKTVYLGILLIGVLVLGIGISRIYLGVHYPSDVLAGYAAAGVWLSGCIMARNTLKSNRRTGAS